MSYCEFCRIANGVSGAVVCYSDPHTLAFAPLEPTAVGHTLVVPREHAAKIWDMSDDAVANLGRAILKVSRALVRAVGCPGLTITNSNGSVATQTIKHVHFHLIPRWKNDGLGPIWFKSKSAEEARIKTAKLIREVLEELPA